MFCPFCEWEMGLGGTTDPAEIVLGFEDHLDEHLAEMMHETGSFGPSGSSPTS